MPLLRPLQFLLLLQKRRYWGLRLPGRIALQSGKVCIQFHSHAFHGGRKGKRHGWFGCFNFCVINSLFFIFCSGYGMPVAEDCLGRHRLGLHHQDRLLLPSDFHDRKEGYTLASGIYVLYYILQSSQITRQDNLRCRLAGRWPLEKNKCRLNIVWIFLYCHPALPDLPSR